MSGSYFAPTHCCNLWRAPLPPLFDSLDCCESYALAIWRLGHLLKLEGIPDSFQETGRRYYNIIAGDWCLRNPGYWGACTVLPNGCTQHLPRAQRFPPIDQAEAGVQATAAVVRIQQPTIAHQPPPYPQFILPPTASLKKAICAQSA